MRPRPRYRVTGQDGFALLTVIVLLMVVTTVVAGFALAARTRLDLAADRLARDRLDLLADGLTTVVAHDLSRAEAALAVASDGTPAACAADGLSILVRVQHQRGLVDLNAAEADLLGLALRSLGLSAAAAKETAATIIAYRSPDLDVATAARAALTRDGLRGAPFVAVEELHGFAALAAVPAGRLSATFTTASGAAEVAGPHLPPGLARVLPRAPTPLVPFVAAEAPRAGRYAIEVFVRGSDGTLGRAGRLVEIDAEGAHRRERLHLAGGAPEAAPMTRALPCPALLGSAAAAHLQGAAP